MNKLIKDQLTKVTSVKLEFDDDTEELYIPKTDEISSLSVKIGNIYKVELDDSLLHPLSNSTFAANWNSGRVPKNKVYIIDVIDILYNYIKCNGVAINDQSDSWYG